MRIQNCLVTKHGVTCLNEIKKNKIKKVNFDYLIGYFIFKFCERIIINSIDNLKVLNENLSYLDGVAFN